MSVALVGNYPPPYGGVQTHIARVHSRLRKAGIPSAVYCAYSEARQNESGVRLVHHPWWGRRKLGYWGYHWFFAYGWRLKEVILHCHEQWRMAAAVLPLALRGHRVVMTIHDQMLTERWADLTALDRMAAQRLIRQHKVAWIAVNRTVRGQLEGLGVWPEQITDLPAYIPLDPEDAGPEELPGPLRSFLASHTPMISTYAWWLVADAEGNDLHSLDQCLDLMVGLRTRYPKAGLVILVGNASDEERMAALQHRVAQGGLEENVHICVQPLKDAGRLWSASDVYLRATTTDGDAVSVREALSLRVPVVASDAAPRPAGTIVFRKRDYNGMSQAVGHVLANRESCRRALQDTVIADNFDPLLALYRRLLTE